MSWRLDGSQRVPSPKLGLANFQTSGQSSPGQGIACQDRTRTGPQGCETIHGFQKTPTRDCRNVSNGRAFIRHFGQAFSSKCTPTSTRGCSCGKERLLRISCRWSLRKSDLHRKLKRQQECEQTHESENHDSQQEAGCDGTNDESPGVHGSKPRKGGFHFTQNRRHGHWRMGLNEISKPELC